MHRLRLYGNRLSHTLRSCFEFLLRQIARYLPHHRSENASKTHPKSSHDKFKTASKEVFFHFL